MTAHQSVNRVTEAAAKMMSATNNSNQLTPSLSRKFSNPTPATLITSPPSPANPNSSAAAAAAAAAAVAAAFPSTAATASPTKKPRIFINIFNPELSTKKKEADPLIVKPLVLSSNRLYLKSPRMIAARQSRLQFSRPPIPSSRLNMHHMPEIQFASRLPKPILKSERMLLINGNENNQNNNMNNSKSK